MNCWKSTIKTRVDKSCAVIAATFQNIDVNAYIERLPLDRVKQIHVSGIRMKDGRFYDAHESLEEGDYEILKWVLGKSEPEIVTLEYFREKELLREQLLRLQEIVPPHKTALAQR